VTETDTKLTIILLSSGNDNIWIQNYENYNLGEC